jgi:hypothetical protein
VTPPQFPPGQKMLSTKVTGLCSPALPKAGTIQSQATRVTLTLGGKCPNATSFLYKGSFWFAAFGNTVGRSDYCCGTNTYGISEKI